MKLAWMLVGALALSGTAFAQQEPAERQREEQEQTEERATERAEEVGQKASSKIESTTEEVTDIVYAKERGVLENGEEVANTIVTDPVGVILGDGVNAQYFRPVSPKISAVVGGRFARTRLGDGAATTAGVTGGVDFFMLGMNNEGLRIGPRIIGNVGTETIGENAIAGSIGAGGELGYNWIADSGVTAGIAGGVNALLGGSVNVDVEGFGEAGINPYGRINIGYSW